MSIQLKKSYLVAAIGAAFLVAGCGSGDDSGGSAGASTAGFQVGSFGFSSSSAPPLSSARTSPSEVTIDRATDLAVTALNRATSLLLADRIFTQELDFFEQAYIEQFGSVTEDCEQGTLTVNQSDTAPTAQLSDGDALDFTLNNCDGQNGSLRYAFDKYVGSVNNMLDANIRILADLTTTDAATGLRGTEVGQADRVVNRGSGGFITQANTRGLTVSIIRDGKEASTVLTGGYRNSFANLDSSVQEAAMAFLDDGKAPGARVIAGTDSAYRFNSPVLGFDASRGRFSSGVIDIEAKGNIRMTVLSFEAIRIQLDQQKDGMFERDCTFSYQALLDGQAAFTETACQGEAGAGGGGGGSTPPPTTPNPPSPLEQIPVLGPTLGGLPVIGDLLGTLLGQ